MYAPIINIKNASLAIATMHSPALNRTTALACPGGKSKQVRFLTTLMPTDIGKFYEPFAGGLGTTNYLIRTGRVESKNCNIGDLDPHIINFYRVLRSDYENLTIELLKIRTFHGSGSRDLFNDCLRIFLGKSSPLECAVAYFVYNKLCMEGSRDYLPGSWPCKNVLAGAV